MYIWTRLFGQGFNRYNICNLVLSNRSEENFLSTKLSIRKTGQNAVELIEKIRNLTG